MSTQIDEQNITPSNRPEALRLWVTPVFARLNLKDALTGDGGLLDGEFEPNS